MKYLICGFLAGITYLLFRILNEIKKRNGN